MTVPPPEYGEEDRLRQRPGRMRQQPEGVLPPDREDAPEPETQQHDRQGREVKYLDPEDNEAHAPGRVCGRCGAVITAGQDVRRGAGGKWLHEVCP
jgi:hypothetical protein